MSDGPGGSDGPMERGTSADSDRSVSAPLLSSTQRYSPHQRILCVGEGNFTWSLALLNSWRNAGAGNDGKDPGGDDPDNHIVSTPPPDHDHFDLTATAYEPLDRLLELYQEVAEGAMAGLVAEGASVHTGVDATRLAETLPPRPDGLEHRYDRVIFQFPLALHLSTEEAASAASAQKQNGGTGGTGTLRVVEAVARNRALLQRFLASAAGILRPGAEVHITCKVDEPYRSWDMPRLRAAGTEGRELKYVGQFPFRADEYPGYRPTNICSNKGFAVTDRQRVVKALTYVFKVVDTQESSHGGNVATQEGQCAAKEGWCEICRVQCSSQAELERFHFTGKKHKRKEYLESLWS